MIITFLLLPFLFIFASTLSYNNQVMQESKSFITKYSLLESILSSLIITILFLQGFIPTIIILLIIFVLMMVLSFIIMSIKGQFNIKGVLELETIKNNIILFSATVLPLYVFLTIFRYLPFYFQIPLAILSSSAIFYSKQTLIKLFQPIYKKIHTFFSIIGIVESMVIYIGIFLLFLSTLLLQFPSNVIGETLNLSNNTPYFSIQGFPVDLQNNFRQNEILKLDIEELLGSEVLDYYYENEYLYLYTNKNELVIYNVLTTELINTYVLETITIIDHEHSKFNGDFNYMFVKHDDYLILFGHADVFKVTLDGAESIIDVNNNNMKHYYDNGELYILYSASPTLQKIYKFNNGEMILSETISLSLFPFDSMVVISETLFYIDNNRYILASNNNISFIIKSGSTLFDKEKKVIYYVTDESTDYSSISVYSKVTSTDSEFIIKNSKMYNYYGIMIKDQIFYTDYSKINEYSRITSAKRIMIVDDEFEISTIFNHQELQPFLYGNFFHNSYIANYHNEDDNLEFLQVDENLKHVVLTLYQLEELDVDIKFPFYSHYGVGILTTIFVFLFIPTTHNRSTHIESGFDVKTSKNGNNIVHK